jgi:hypothetical protein
MLTVAQRCLFCINRLVGQSLKLRFDEFDARFNSLLSDSGMTQTTVEPESGMRQTSRMLLLLHIVRVD